MEEADSHQSPQNQNWQLADARVLGQILAAQNVIFVLPDIVRIAEYYAQILLLIPGIRACRVCLETVTVMRGETEMGTCSECLEMRKKAAEQPEASTLGTRFICSLSNQTNIHVIEVYSLHHYFGFFVLFVSDPQIFTVYEPFISNLASFIAISLENRLQRGLLQQAHDELERKVDERTRDLMITNRQLRDEIETRRQVEKSLRESEQQIAQLIDNSPIAMVVSVGPKEHIERINQKFIEVFGYTIKDMPDTDHWWSLAYPDEKYREEIKALWQTRVEKAVRDKNRIDPMEAMVVCKDGSRRYVEFRLSSIGQKRLVTFVDLTEHKQAEKVLQRLNRELRAISNCNQTLLRAVDEQTLLDDICHIVCDEAGYHMAWVGYAENDEAKTVRPMAWAGREAGYLASADITWADTERGRGPTGRAIRSGKSVNIQDFMTDSQSIPWREAASQRGYRSSIAMPLQDENNITFGAFNIYSAEPNAYTPEEIRFLEELASDLAFGITTLRTRIKRRQAEEALRESEMKFRAVFENSVDAIGISKRGVHTFVNPAYLMLFGYIDNAELIGKPILDLIAPTHREKILEYVGLRASGQPAPAVYETRGLRKDGSEFDMDVHVSTYELHGETYTVPIIRDITERKKAEAQLLASEQLFRTLVENSPDYIARYDLEFRRIYINPAIQKLFGVPSENVLNKTPVIQSPLYAPQVYIDHLRRVIETAADDTVEMPFRTVRGEIHWGHMRFAPEFGPDGKVISVIAIGRDIHEIKENERRFRMLAENFPDFVARFDRDGRFTYANSALVKMLEISQEAIVGKTLSELPLISQLGLNDSILAMIRHAFDEGVPNESETYRSIGIGERTFEIRHVPEKDAADNVVSVLSIIRDITERNQHELEREAIITVSNALRKATTRTEILTVILDQLVDLFTADGAMLASPSSSTGEIVVEMGRGLVGKRFTGLHIPPGQGISGWVIANKQPYLNNQADADPRFYRPELLTNAICVAAVPLIAREQAIGALWIARLNRLLKRDLRLFSAIGDIAANALYRVTLYEQTETQLHHLMALHQIDIAIATDFDLDTTLKIILDNVKNELKVDAASILLLTPFTQILKYGAGIGFRTRTIEQANLKLGVGHAGQAALEYRTGSYSYLDQTPTDPDFSMLVSVEGFMSHFVTPLIVKGQVKGVLEVFCRQTFEPQQEWLDYFETLATQTAIAIDNASLFESLQRSNTELRLAYDATIEGWSRALDLRDKETEGHTLRVTEMALRLANLMGMSDNEKLNLRRGALLHDIGKMGVPDGILLKPGPLTDDEWKVMRQHPSYAYEMLKSIDYLRPALDIPYCHHERWDGTGYPRGLKAEAIPLAARVFAVIDVFDALIVDRPYRRAWPKDQVYTYIQEQSGKYFDPQVVMAFLRIDWEQN